MSDDDIKTSLKSVTTELKVLLEELASQKRSLDDLWREVKKLGGEVRSLPEKMCAVMIDHEGQCLARERVQFFAPNDFLCLAFSHLMKPFYLWHI